MESLVNQMNQLTFPLLQPRRENRNYEHDLSKVQCFTCIDYGCYSQDCTKTISPGGTPSSKGYTKGRAHVNLIEVQSDVREKAITKYKGSLQEKVDVMAQYIATFYKEDEGNGL